MLEPNKPDTALIEDIIKLMTVALLLNTITVRDSTLNLMATIKKVSLEAL